MTLDLMPASTYSLEALTELYNRARADYLVPMPMTPDSMAAYVSHHDVVLDASLVAQVQSEPAGLALLGLRDDRAWITRMGVIREVRRSGVGRVLLDGLLDMAVNRGAASAQLEVIADNAIGQRLFRACGFEPVRRLLVLSRPPGAPMDLTLVPDRLLNNAEARAVLESGTIGYPPSWVEEAPSLLQARRLAGIVVDQAALLYGDDGVMLSPVALCNADGMTGPALLGALHSQWPMRPALKENVPEGHPQAEWFADAGYEPAFARLEMRRAL
ncbi:MAG TPA: GNAT family N-acetyltransferase [Candidatus Limnocylindrales bacterium]|nr:GNAT family N-acetyltransferase [Candidatus Limnocylindrales bacterium]